MLMVIRVYTDIYARLWITASAGPSDPPGHKIPTERCDLSSLVL